MVECIQYEYEDPAEGAGWDGREAGHQVATSDTHHVLWEYQIVGDD